MKRIGLTQRVEFVQSHDEKRDCLDQRWAVLFEQLDLMPVPLLNQIQNVDSYLTNLELDGFVLTGGNDLVVVQGAVNTAPERDRFETELLNFATKKSMPVLGVCRGMQMLASFHGSLLSKLSEHRAKRHLVQTEPGLGWPISFEVNSTHTCGIQKHDLTDVLKTLAIAADGTVEAFVHETLPQYGVMWHPEREVMLRDEDLLLFKELFS